MMVVLPLDAEARGKSHDIYREHNRVVRYHRCQNNSLLARLLRGKNTSIITVIEDTILILHMTTESDGTN